MVRRPTPSDGFKLALLLGLGASALWSPAAAPDSGDPCSDPGAVVINEFLPDPSGTDGGLEWIELYNTCGADVDLSGWLIYTGTSSHVLKHTFASGTLLAAGDYLLLGDAGYTGSADALSGKTLNIGNASSTSDSIKLATSAGLAMDIVVYGSPNTDGWTDIDGATVSRPGPTPLTDYSLARTEDGDNDGDDADDLCLEVSPTPDAPNNPSCVPDTPCDGVGADDTGCPSDSADSGASDSGASDSGASDSGVGAESGADSGDADPCAAYAGLVINEVLYDAVGTDSPNEWVELYNGSPNTLDLGAVTLYYPNGKSWTSRGALAGTLAPGQPYLIGESAVSGADITLTLGLGNAGSNADGVQLRCGGEPLDTVLYGKDNSEGLEDDLTWGTGVGSSSLATPAASNAGQSIGRRVNGVDTDLSADDFAPQDAVSPGELNPEPVPCVTTGVESLRLNELLVSTAQTGDEEAWEWLELVNTSADTPVFLAGFTLQVAGSKFSTDPSDGYSFADDLVLLPGEYLLLAGPSALVDESAVEGTLVRYTEADYGPLGLGNAGSNADGVQLVDCEGTPVDTVVYASSAEKNENEHDPLYCDNSDFTDVAPLPGDDESLGRSPDGVDTNLCAADWEVFVPDAERAPTPGYGNPEPIPCSTVGTEGLRLNELLVDPSNTGSDDPWEWIELYNGSTETVDLGGFTLHLAGDVFKDEPGYTFGAGLTLAPGELLLLAGPSVALTDADVHGRLVRYNADTWLGLGNAGGSSDGAQLRDCTGAVVDTVVYGDAGSNAEHPLYCDNNNIDDIALVPDADQSLGRAEDGVDTNVCATDWRIFGGGDGLLPTPGQPNDTLPECLLGGRDAVRLNELLSNPGIAEGYDSLDDNREWVELVNPSDAEVNLGGWSLQVASSEFETAVNFDETVVIPAGGFLVVHGSAFEGAPVEGAVYLELPDRELTLGNANSNDDGVRLVDCAGEVVDTVLYGPAAALPTLEDDAESAGTLAPTPLENASIGRYPDGDDTNDHKADWLAFPVPSPGAANPELGGGGGPDPDDCGCGGRPEQPEAPGLENGGRCATSGMPPGTWALAAGLFALRRRRGSPGR